MTRRAWAVLGVFAAVGGALAVGCTDLFHGFDDLENACGQTSACADDGSVSVSVANDAGADAPATRDAAPGETNFCAWTSEEALDHAQHACAWLGACESPMGHNQLGECMVQAVLAFDCAANPTMPVRGALKAYWDALRTATSCNDVYAVTLTGAPCPAGEFSACGGGDRVLGAGNTRVECMNGSSRAAGERCLASGQVCVARDEATTVGRCTGSDELACKRTRCDGTSLHVCNDAGADGGNDLGRACEFFGGGDCATTAVGVGCAPTKTTTCIATANVTCSDMTTATSCATGLLETLQCNLVLPGSTCVATKLALGESILKACVGGDAGKPDAGGESCGGFGGSAATSSARGASFTVACAAQGLGGCTIVQTLEGPRAACTAPRDGG